MRIIENIIWVILLAVMALEGFLWIATGTRPSSDFVPHIAAGLALVRTLILETDLAAYRAGKEAR